MSTADGKHIMLSYAWDGGHRKVNQIAREFRSAGIPIWMDTKNGLGKDLIDGMAEAVEDSLAVCCFITPEYQESKCCQMELKYANELNKPIIPCFLTDFKPRKWLGLLTAGLIRYDLSDNAPDTVLDPLIRYIKRDILKIKSKVSAKPAPKPVRIETPILTVQHQPHKTAVGDADSDEEESSSDNVSSTAVSWEAITNKQSSTDSMMSNLSINRTHQKHKTSGSDQQIIRKNRSQDSQRYKQYL